MSKFIPKLIQQSDGEEHTNKHIGRWAQIIQNGHSSLVPRFLTSNISK